MEGDAGLGGVAEEASGFASFVAGPPSSARILSSLASRPAAAWDRNEPHPVFLVGAAILDQRGHFEVVKPLDLAIKGETWPFFASQSMG